MLNNKHCLQRLLYDLTLSVGDHTFGVGPLAVRLQPSNAVETDLQSLYVWLVCQCPWLMRVQHQPTLPTIDEATLALLSTFSFDTPVEEYECTVLVGEYSRYRALDNIHYLVSDYFCFTTLPTFLTIIPMRSKSLWVDVFAVETFQQQVLDLLTRYAGERATITYEDLLQMKHVTEKAGYTQFATKGYTKSILNSLLLLCSNMYQSVKYSTIARVHRDYNKRSVQCGDLKRKATGVGGAPKRRKATGVGGAQRKRRNQKGALANQAECGLMVVGDGV